MRNIYTDMIEEILKLNDLLLKLANEKIFKNTSLTPTQFNILWEIIHHNWLEVNELKEKLIISAPALSQILNRMEKSKLIERKIGKTDRRSILILPLKPAIKLYNDINNEYVKLADSIFHNFWEQKATQTIEYIKEIQTYL